MPLARLSVPAHLPQDQVFALADAVHQGLVSTCGVPMDDRFQLITRFASDAMVLNPTFPNVQRTPDACIVEITFLRDRSDGQKAALYRHVVGQAAEAGFVGDDIMIVLTENGAMDWSLGRGESYASVAHT